jgi:hypothetical protein
MPILEAVENPQHTRTWLIWYCIHHWEEWRCVR